MLASNSVVAEQAEDQDEGQLDGHGEAGVSGSSRER